MTFVLPLAYPDQEQVYVDLLGLVTIPGLTIRVVTRLPSDPPDGLVWVQRIGGGADDGDITDYALMRVSTYHSTRNMAWRLANECERMILGHRGRSVDRPGSLSHRMMIDFAALDTGGSIDPDLDPDERRVTKNYSTGMRRQYHLV